MRTRREHQIDEFESVFRASVRPHPAVHPRPVERILVAVDPEAPEERRRALEACVAALVRRHQAEVLFMAPAGTALEGRVEPFTGAPAPALLRLVETFRPSLVALPVLYGEYDETLVGFSLGSLVDRVLRTEDIPLLLVKDRAGEETLDEMLLVLEDEATSGEVLSAAAGLASPGAAMTLLHVLDQQVIDACEKGLKLAREVDTEQVLGALVGALDLEMRHYMEGACQALQALGHPARLELRRGEPVGEVLAHVGSTGLHRLVVCNTNAPLRDRLDPFAYDLAVRMGAPPLLLV